MASDTPRRKKRQPNPLATRLTKRAGCLAGNTAVALSAALGLLATWLVIRGIKTLHLLYTPTLALTFGGTLSLPIFIVYVAANLTVGHANSPEYTILCATSLSNDKIVKGYVLAVLHYCRGPLTLMIGLTPGLVLTAIPILTKWTYSPSAIYNSVWAQTDLGTLGVVLKWSTAALSCGLGMLGINFMAVALGVGFGLWWRDTISAALVALVTTIGTTLAVAYGLHRLVVSLNILDVFLRHILQYTLFVPIPYLLAFGCMRLARRWARKPD